MHTRASARNPASLNPAVRPDAGVPPEGGKTGAMARGRRWLIVIAVVTVVLVGLGLWRRSTLIDERTRARAERGRALHQLHALRQGIVNASTAAGAVEVDNLALRDATQSLIATASALTDQIRGVEQARDDAALNTFVVGGQIGKMRECLDGVTRALNQVSVGDEHAVGTLNSVQSACRAVGA